MNPEKLQLKGLLVESKKQYQTLDMESSGLVILIRALLNPYEETLKLETEKIIVAVERLHSIQNKMKALKEKIDKLEGEFV